MATQEVSKIIRKHYVEVTSEKNGKPSTSIVEVARNSSIEHYPPEIVIYENKLAKGAKAGTSEYWVAVKDFIPSKRVSSKEAMSAILSELHKNPSMSVEELARKYNVEIQ